MLGGRYALLIATSNFSNAGLQQLRSPVRDVEGLASVLKDPQIGDFDVTTALDQEQHQVTRAIESFFRSRSREDLLLLHISSHGLKADHGELYFAARDTDRDLLASTAISAAFLQSQMSRCRAKSIVLLLDCCYSGAFLLGAKGDSSVHVKDELAGHGRAVLTATNRTEYAWEGDHLSELEPEPSHFTGAIIDGLSSGDADRNQDGKITVSELYDFVYDRVRSKNKMQSPQMWAELEYQVVVARSPFAVEQSAETLPGMESAVDLSLVPEIKDPGPLSSEFPDATRRENSVAQLKRALPDPVRRIEVFDLIDNAITDVIAKSTLENRPVSGPVFASNIKGYRADSDLLLHLLATGVFHDDGSHDNLWARVIERLSRLRDKNLQAFNEALEHLRLYPALLATWAMGIAAMLSRRDQLLGPLLTKQSFKPPFSSQRRQAPAYYLNPLRVVSPEPLNEICHSESGARYIYPQSHFLREELREPFRAIEPDDTAYAEACNRFEFLASLIAMDVEPSTLATPWAGEFLLDSNWGYDQFGLAGEIAEEIDSAWPLLKTGAFGSDVERAKKAFEALVDFRAKHPRW
ncbi:caspase family protein [Streptomyces pactum]|uniref:Caspase family protein n=1 Tax=Streptomyces pactum TaxID=68249 RepID=A0ABS0NIH2_9ACTN|nr:caspase family protein [Streptomyces pactum]MBH5334894.1 caspase family protein [Streptomyces pactum]